MQGVLRAVPVHAEVERGGGGGPRFDCDFFLAHDFASLVVSRLFCVLFDACPARVSRLGFLAIFVLYSAIT
jgi:hypothetical protein